MQNHLSDTYKFSQSVEGTVTAIVVAVAVTSTGDIFCVKLDLIKFGDIFYLRAR